MGLLLALTLPWVIVCGVNALYGCSPQTAAGRCNRACAQKKSKDPHAGVLPKWLSGSGPRSATGRTIRGLYGIADRLGTTYRVVNVVVYCVLWPGLMAALLGVGLWQTRRLQRLRGAP